MKVGIDKILHFVVCFVIALLLSLITNNVIIGWASAISIGIAKELYDKYDYGLFDIYDLIADAIGATVGIILILLI